MIPIHHRYIHEFAPLVVAISFILYLKIRHYGRMR